MFRIYGPTIGNASNARVTRGVISGMKACGVFAGHVPLDAMDEDEVYDGAFADSCLFIGPFNLVGVIHHGEHQHKYALAQPNSTWMPRGMVDCLGFHAEPVVPSEWAKSVAQPHWLDKRITVYPHGLEESFRPSIDNTAELQADFDKGIVRFLHLSSSMLDRKGTDKLVLAWNQLVQEKHLPDGAHLDLVIAEGDQKVQEMISPEAASSISILNRFNASAKNIAEIYQRYHFVIQPSRGESFGLCGLEARACGVPIIVTGCTGHSEWLDEPGYRQGTPHSLMIETHELCDIDDGPGALAPRLEVDDVAEAISAAVARWPRMKRGAMDWANARGSRWSWPVVTEKWLQQLKG
jgi:glycosyltransferase involved in cell wall biosynthesis